MNTCDLCDDPDPTRSGSLDAGPQLRVCRDCAFRLSLLGPLRWSENPYASRAAWSEREMQNRLFFHGLVTLEGNEEAVCQREAQP